MVNLAGVELEEYIKSYFEKNCFIYHEMGITKSIDSLTGATPLYYSEMSPFKNKEFTTSLGDKIIFREPVDNEYYWEINGECIYYFNN